MGYFNPQIKDRSEDFFNFEPLQMELRRVIEDAYTPLIAVHGLRRTGKTSLIRVVLSTLRRKHVWIDSRSIASREEFFHRVAQAVQAIRHPTLERISIKGMSWDFTSRHGDFEYLNKKKMILVLDEAQLLHRLKLDYLVASLFDTHPHIKIILSGSETGMLMRFLGKKNAKAPLYGRAVWELQTRRLSREEAYHFLVLGAKEEKLDFSEKEIAETTERLGGIIGWLTKYGWYRRELRHAQALLKTIEDGKQVAWQEFIRFSARSEKRYLEILRSLKEGARWSDSRAALTISDKQLLVMLKRLEGAGFIEKRDERWWIADPLLREALS